MKHEEHICRFNDGDQSCDCYDAGYEAGEEKQKLKNAGLYRQLFGEMTPDKTFTVRELRDIFDGYSPLFTQEQKVELKEYLNSIMKKK